MSFALLDLAEWTSTEETARSGRSVALRGMGRAAAARRARWKPFMAVVEGGRPKARATMEPKPVMALVLVEREEVDVDVEEEGFEEDRRWVWRRGCGGIDIGHGEGGIVLDGTGTKPVATTVKKMITAMADCGLFMIVVVEG